MIDDAGLNISLQTLATLTTQAEPLFVRSFEGPKAVLFMVLLTAQGLRAYYFTGDLTRLFMLGFHRVAAYIIHRGMAFLCTAAAQLYANVNPQALPVAACQSSRLQFLSSSLHRQKGKKPFRSLRNLKTDLDLTVEGDLNIVMAFAEKLRAGLHSFVFGKPFYTSMQERDVLVSFWLDLHFMNDVLEMDGNVFYIILFLPECMHASTLFLSWR